MSVDNFKRTVWHANLLNNLRNKVVSELGVNHDYEGDAQGAKAVKICRIGKVTLRDYVSGEPITYDKLDITDTTLLIDQQKIVGVEVEDADKAQTANGAHMMVKATEEMSDAIAQGRDKANFKCMSDEAGTIINTDEDVKTITTSDEVKDLILDAKTHADTINVPEDGRILFASHVFLNKLLSDKTINISQPTCDASLVKGYVGRLYGIDLVGTNNLPKTDGGNEVVILTHRKFTTEADQIYNMEALRDKDTVGDYVRCFYVSGRKVTMPEGVIKAVVKCTK